MKSSNPPQYLVVSATCNEYVTDSPTCAPVRLSEIRENMAAARISRLPSVSRRTAIQLKIRNLYVCYLKLTFINAHITFFISTHLYKHKLEQFIS